MRERLFAGYPRVVALIMAVPLLWVALALPAAAAQLATWASLAPSVEPYDDPFAEMPFEKIDDLRTILRADMAEAAGQLDTAWAERVDAARRRLGGRGPLLVRDRAGQDHRHLHHGDDQHAARPVCQQRCDRGADRLRLRCAPHARPGSRQGHRHLLLRRSWQ